MTMDDDHLEPYPSRTDSVGFDFLRSELELGIGFAKVAKTEQRFKEESAANKAKLLAEQAYVTFRKFHPLVRDITEQQQSELRGLEVALRDALLRLEEQNLPSSESDAGEVH